MKNINSLLFALLFLALAPMLHANQTQKSVDIGVLATRGDAAAKMRWQPTLDWLETEIDNTHFKLHSFSIDEMAKAVKNKQIDFIITNPGQSVSLGRQYDLTWLATLDNQPEESPSHAIGSTLLVKANSPYQTLKDLQGKKLIAVDKNAFGGYQTFVHEVQQHSFDLGVYFSQVRFLGFPIDAMVYHLRDDLAEAIIVPTCLVEQMQLEGLIKKYEFRVINQQKNNKFHCMVSTPLYPNWSFAGTSQSEARLSKKITRALLAMPSESLAAISAKSSGWTPMVSHSSIEKMYHELDINQLKIRWWIVTLRWLGNHQQWMWGLFIFIISLSFYHFLIEYRFSKSKKQLAETLNQLKEKNSMLEHAQRVAIVGELGSSLAHEINQPLAAIRNYSQGGLMRIKNGNSSEEVMSVFEMIQHQVSRADKIITRLRGLINKQESVKKMCDMEALIADTLVLLDYALKKKNITFQVNTQTQTSLIFIDQVGMQQVILNLISNAADACFQKSKGEFQRDILLTTRYEDSTFYLSVVDNGTGLEKTSKQLQTAFFTTKESGLGLGLAICRNVIESHHGQLTLENNINEGCTVTISIPIEKEHII